MPKEAIFICERYPQLMLTVVPYGLKNPAGGKIKAEHIMFRTDPRYGVGTYRTSSEKHIEFLRKHEYSSTGHIKEVVEENQIPVVKPPASKVTRGLRTSLKPKAPSPGPPLPPDVPREAGPAKVPSKKGKKAAKV